MPKNIVKHTFQQREYYSCCHVREVYKKLINLNLMIEENDVCPSSLICKKCKIEVCFDEFTLKTILLKNPLTDKPIIFSWMKNKKFVSKKELQRREKQLKKLGYKKITYNWIKEYVEVLNEDFWLMPKKSWEEMLKEKDYIYNFYKKR
jgi:hypothetical protein